MIIGLTGANGFIGSNIINYLKNYDLEVIILNVKNDLELQINEHKKFDWILHFGANTVIPDTIEQSDIIYIENISSTLNALALAKQCNSSILFLSSYVYGNPDKIPINEEHKLSALNSYINSKIICERLCNDFMNDINKSVIILRCFNIYGYGLKPGRLVHDIIFSAINENKIILNDPHPKRDYLYIDDFCELIINIISKDKIIKNIYNVGSGVSYSNMEIAEIIKIIAKIDSNIIVKNKPRNNEVNEIVSDISLVTKTFEWSPRTNIKDGLKLTLSKYSI